jgi:hypothetical protein
MSGDQEEDGLFRRWWFWVLFIFAAVQVILSLCLAVR